MRRGFRVSPSMVVAVTALVVACAGGAYAAGEAANRSIAACVRHNGGGLYVAKRCAKRDRSLRWNVTGPRGAPGADGQQGAAGAPGKPGAPGAPATTLFAQIKADGTVNASGSPVTTSRRAAGVYLVNFGRDITHCVAVANEGGVPVFTLKGASTPAAEGNGVRVDIVSAGVDFAPGFPSASTVAVQTFSGATASDSSFVVAVLC
jgi:hypothetical protein